MAVQLDQIRAAAERVAATHHLEVVDVSFTGAGKHRALQVFVEKDAPSRTEAAARAVESEGEGVPKGVPTELLSWTTHEDCAQFAQDFGTLLDVEDLVPGTLEYTLEVSSPGIDRGLFKPEDWARFAGSVVKVKTFQSVMGSRSLTGRMEFEEGVVKLDLAAVNKKGKPGSKKAEPKVVAIPLAEIERANLVPEF